MVLKAKKDIRPFFVQLGAALALSLAGFLLSRLKSRKSKSPMLPHSPASSDHTRELAGGGGAMNKTPNMTGIKVLGERNEDDTCMLKVAVDNPTDVPSPTAKCNGDKDWYLLPEFDNLVQEYDFNATNARSSPKDREINRSDMETPKAFASMENNDFEEEVINLKAVIRRLQERETDLEAQLLECYGLKEQESAMMELQNRLKINKMEAKLFTLKINKLQADNQRLQAQLADHEKIVADLDAAKSKIKFLRKMLKSEAERNREQILVLQKRVAIMQEQELKATTDSDIHSKLERLKDLEAEVDDLRQSNFRLQTENLELAHKLESTQVLANSVLKDPESEVLKALSNRLRLENEELVKQVEQLQADRCADVEELVYLRWINACLRYELRNLQPPDGKIVARDLSRSLSPRSEERAKQLILEYANMEELGEKGIDHLDFDYDQWSSCPTSYVMDPTDLDESSVSTKPKNSSKAKIFNKLRSLIRGKDVPQHHNHRSLSSKSGGTEDSESPRGSSCISTASDLHYSRAQSMSPDIPKHSVRHSADIRRPKNPTTDEMQDIKIGRRFSDTITCYGHRRYSSTGVTAVAENQDSYPAKNTEILKFAQVLKDSGSETGKVHRKSASLGAF